MIIKKISVVILFCFLNKPFRELMVVIACAIIVITHIINLLFFIDFKVSIYNLKLIIFIIKLTSPKEFNIYCYFNHLVIKY